MSPTDRLAAAQLALDSGIAENAAGRPARASARFRTALRRLGEPAADRAAHPDPAGPGSPAPPADPAVPPNLTDDVGHRTAAQIRARALLSLVMSDYELRADVAASRAVLDDAERWAVAAGAVAVRFAVHGQRGLLALRAGDVDGALRELDRAAAHLADADPLDACVLLLNRGALHLERGDLTRARADLTACAERAGHLGDDVLRYKARHNLGYLEFLAGDLPAALAAMDAAARIDHGGPLPVALLDRAQVLIEAGLTTEADQTLGRAATLFARHQAWHDLAEVELARAHCALLAREPAQALVRARSARRRFARRDNAPWLVRARLAEQRALLATLLAAEQADPGRGAAHRRALVRLAEGARALAGRARTTQGSGGRELSRAALVTAAEAFVAAGQVGAARAALADSGRLTGRESLSVAVQVRVVRAELALLAGDRSAAVRQVRLGQRALAEHRRRLGSVEAVSAAAVHGDRLTAAEVGAALARGRAGEVLDAVERGRATFAGPARVRPPQDPVLADLLAELRQVVERERLLPPGADDGGPGGRGALRREAARLRVLARERSWHLGDGVGAPVPTTAADLRAWLCSQAGARADERVTVADYLVHRGQVHAVVADATGVRLLGLAPAAEVEELARRLRADLQVLANPALPPVLREAATRSLRSGLRGLDERLVAPLDCPGPLQVVADGGMVTLPWAMVPSRVGRATGVSPRLRLPEPGTARPPASVVAMAGPGLVHAEAEVAAVARNWSHAASLVGPSADCAAAAQALRTADVVHLAAHGHHQSENPLFSWVRLADGPLFAHELEGSRLPGSLVVLSACEVGRATVRPGGEVLGLASVLLRLGAGVVVAALAPLRDEVAAAVMPALHGRLQDGDSAQAALATACADLDEPVPLACFTADVGAGGGGSAGTAGRR